MRVHELDEAYGITKDEVKAALELAGLNTHHMSNLDEAELKEFEAALHLGEEDVVEVPGEVVAFDEDGVPVVEISDPALFNAANEIEGDGSGYALPDAIDGAEWEHNPQTGETKIVAIHGEGDFIESPGVAAAIADFESACAGEPSPLDCELTPHEHIFPCCDDSGSFTENCILEPGLAARVACILGNHRINSYVLNLDRGEFIFVVWETAQKHRVPIDG